MDAEEKEEVRRQYVNRYHRMRGKSESSLSTEKKKEKYAKAVNR